MSAPIVVTGDLPALLHQQPPSLNHRSDAGTDSGDRRSAGPSTPTTTVPPPQTSVVAPLPEVDEEALWRLDRILRSMPSEMDTAAVYASLKARLGISRSRDLATTSAPENLPQNPPYSSQTQAPLHAPEPTPFFPLVQYSGDSDKKKKEGRSLPPLRPMKHNPCHHHMQRAHLVKMPRHHRVTGVLPPPSKGRHNR
ncbi:uncharacterized protein LOC121800413 [Salvia splendens]|uniref:uncharacterized protein LOC121800413 n=1 Tax=Salvia splendens TaxID=180675 RepID=UPI001C26FAE9|nr:uncharacterized protein LOC121800413 [Salvia splendens]